VTRVSLELLLSCSFNTLRLHSLTGGNDERPCPDVICAALLSRYMIIALRSTISSFSRQVPLSRSNQDVRAIAAAAVTSRPELLAHALALVTHACPDGFIVASGLRKLAFDEYIKNCDTDNLVRLLELECNASFGTHQDTRDPAQKPSGGAGDALVLCVGVLGKPGDLSDSGVHPDVELVLIESVSAALILHVIVRHFLEQVLGLCIRSIDAATEAAWRVALQSFRAWMRMPQDIKSTCRPFARRADIIIARLVMMRQTHTAARIAAAVPTEIPEAVIVTLARQALAGLPKNLDSPCISLAPRTGASAPPTSAKKIGEVKALDRPPVDFAQRVASIAAAFSFVDAPSAALCLSILGIMSPAAAAMHALEIANTHGSNLVYGILRYYPIINCVCLRHFVLRFVSFHHTTIHSNAISGTRAPLYRVETSCLSSTRLVPQSPYT
jgi:hypothetical protein